VHHNEDLCGPLIPIRNERPINQVIQTTTTYNCGRAPQGYLTRDWNWDYEESAYCEPLEDTQLGFDCPNDIMRAAEAGDTTALAAAIADTEQDIDLMQLSFNALMLAAKYDHQDVARMLLDAGAATGGLTSNPFRPDFDNWSNVMVAAWYGDQEVRAPSSFASVWPRSLRRQYSSTPMMASVASDGDVCVRPHRAERGERFCTRAARYCRCSSPRPPNTWTRRAARVPMMPMGACR